MGGTLPLGYDRRDRKLVINPAEAETVRLIYTLYLELGAVRLLQAEFDRHGTRSKERASSMGQRTGGNRFSRGALYALLTNPLYVGEISHKGARYPGQHAAIVDRDLWESVQRQLQGQGARGRERSVYQPPPAPRLAGPRDRRGDYGGPAAGGSHRA